MEELKLELFKLKHNFTALPTSLEYRLKKIKEIENILNNEY